MTLSKAWQKKDVFLLLSKDSANILDRTAKWVLEEERKRASKVAVARPVGSNDEDEPISEVAIVLYSSG